MKIYASVTLLCFGGFLCLFNFYLSYIRYALYRLMGGVQEDYRFASGIPMIGTLLVTVSLIFLYGTSYFYLGVLFLILDTGGPLWLLITVVHSRLTD